MLKNFFWVVSLPFQFSCAPQMGALQTQLFLNSPRKHIYIFQLHLSRCKYLIPNRTSLLQMHHIHSQMTKERRMKPGWFLRYLCPWPCLLCGISLVPGSWWKFSLQWWGAPTCFQCVLHHSTVPRLDPVCSHPTDNRPLPIIKVWRPNHESWLGLLSEFPHPITLYQSRLLCSSGSLVGPRRLFEPITSTVQFTAPEPIKDTYYVQFTSTIATVSTRWALFSEIPCTIPPFVLPRA